MVNPGMTNRLERKTPTNSPVITGGDPGNLHCDASVGDVNFVDEGSICGVQSLAGQTRPANGRRTCEGHVLVAEVDGSEFVRERGRWVGRIPSSVRPRVIRVISERLYQVKLYITLEKRVMFAVGKVK